MPEKRNVSTVENLYELFYTSVAHVLFAAACSRLCKPVTRTLPLLQVQCRQLITATLQFFHTTEPICTFSTVPQQLCSSRQAVSRRLQRSPLPPDLINTKYRSNSMQSLKYRHSSLRQCSRARSSTLSRHRLVVQASKVAVKDLREVAEKAATAGAQV